MSLIVTNKAGSTIPLLESGVYLSVCIGVVDLGEQLSERFKKVQHKVVLTFEVADESVMVDGSPMPRWLSKTYTASLNEKSTLYQTIIAWRGRDMTDVELEGFDVGELIGTGCQLQVIVRKTDAGVERNDIQAIVGMPKGVKAPVPRSETFVFDIDDPATHGALEKLPAWMRERIEKSTSWARPADANSQKMGMDQAPSAGAASTAGPGF